MKNKHALYYYTTIKITIKRTNTDGIMPTVSLINSSQSPPLAAATNLPPLSRTKASYDIFLVDQLNTSNSPTHSVPLPLVTTTCTETTSTTATTTAQLTQYEHRLQLYNYALQIERFRCPIVQNNERNSTVTAAAMAAMAAVAATASQRQQQQQQYQQHTATTVSPQLNHQMQRYLTLRSFLPCTSIVSPNRNSTALRLFTHEEPKPQHSYIGLIAMAILNSSESKLVLSDIYQYILDNYPYFRSRGPGWRNSIRHNLSLNDCFVKSGRSANGKGHYWSIHPANIEDFRKGDFRRRKAQRKVRRHMGLSVDDGADSPSPPPENQISNILPTQSTTTTFPALPIQQQQPIRTGAAATIFATMQQHHQQQQQQTSSARIVEYYSQHLAATFEQHYHQHNHHHHHQNQSQQQNRPHIITMGEMFNYQQQQQQPQQQEEAPRIEEPQYFAEQLNNIQYQTTSELTKMKLTKQQGSQQYNNKSTKRQFDVASLLAPDTGNCLQLKKQNNQNNNYVNSNNNVENLELNNDEFNNVDVDANTNNNIDDNDLMIDVVAHEDDEDSEDEVHDEENNFPIIFINKSCINGTDSRQDLSYKPRYQKPQQTTCKKT